MDRSTLFFHSDSTNYFWDHKNLISLHMTESEYNHAIEAGFYGEISENRRIIIHEYSHWVQSAGTPYGFYLELVHHYERELLRQLEELIAARLYKENQIKVSPPFKKYIEDRLFYNIQDDELWDLFEHWMDFYFLTVMTDQRRDVYYDTIKQYKSFFSSYPECRHTQDIENYLFLPHLFSRIDNFLDCKLSEYIGRNVPPKTIKREELYSEKNRKIFIASGLNGMLLQITHHSLWESYATVVEYVDAPEEFVFPSKCTADGKQKPWNEYYDPLRYLEIYKPYSNDDKLLFLKSCICLFDIVFSPPVLPQCMLLRDDSISMFDFDIVSRFYAVAEAAKYAVGPISAYPSAGEYMTAICRALHWHTPDEVFFQIYRCWDSLNVIPPGKMFQHFITMRMAGEYLPLNRIRFLDEVRLNHVNPCFLKLKDKMITNTSFSYRLSIESELELLLMNTMLQLNTHFPEPLEYDYEYYQYYLLQELVEKLWENDNKIITLSIPKSCNYIKKIKSHLQTWIHDHFIDVQLNFEYT